MHRQSAATESGFGGSREIELHAPTNITGAGTPSTLGYQSVIYMPANEQVTGKLYGKALYHILMHMLLLYSVIAVSYLLIFQSSKVCSCTDSQNASKILSDSPTMSPTANPSISSSTIPSTALPTTYPTQFYVVNSTNCCIIYQHAFISFNPTVTPTPFPTTFPTSKSTKDPTTIPTMDPTPSPTSNPTPSPTLNPTPSPTSNPIPAPTLNPTPAPTLNPTPAPTLNPTPAPTSNPTPSPTAAPTPHPTPFPTEHIGPDSISQWISLSGAWNVDQTLTFTMGFEPLYWILQWKYLNVVYQMESNNFEGYYGNFWSAYATTDGVTLVIRLDNDSGLRYVDSNGNLQHTTSAVIRVLAWK